MKKKINQNCYKKPLSLQSKHTFDGFGRLYFNLHSMYYSIGKGKKKKALTIKIKEIANFCSCTLSFIKGSSAGFLMEFWNMILKTCIHR